MRGTESQSSPSWAATATIPLSISRENIGRRYKGRRRLWCWQNEVVSINYLFDDNWQHFSVSHYYLSCIVFCNFLLQIPWCCLYICILLHFLLASQYILLLLLDSIFPVIFTLFFCLLCQVFICLDTNTQWFLCLPFLKSTYLVSIFPSCIYFSHFA